MRDTPTHTLLPHEIQAKGRLDEEKLLMKLVITVRVLVSRYFFDLY
jgi:hypothetical protein